MIGLLSGVGCSPRLVPRSANFFTDQNAMDIQKLLSQLRAELATVDDVIIAFERLAATAGEKRRGRPPAWMTANRPPTSLAETKKRTVGPDARARMAAAQRRRWEVARGAEGSN